MCCFDDVAREVTSRCHPEAADSTAQLTALWLSREGRHGCKEVAKCSKHQVLWCSSTTAGGEVSRQDATSSGMGKRRMTTSQRASLHVLLNNDNCDCDISHHVDDVVLRLGAESPSCP
jgi:hypothetical protein